MAELLAASSFNSSGSSVVIVSIIPGSSDKATTSQANPSTEDNLPDIGLSFTDQIPDIAGGPTEASV